MQHSCRVDVPGMLCRRQPAVRHAPSHQPLPACPPRLQYVFTALSPSGLNASSSVTNPLQGRFTGLRPATQ